jgi:pectate lyase
VDFKAIIKTPFRPGEGFAALSGKMAWVWVPCLTFLVVGLLVRVTVATPRQIVFQNDAMKAANAQAQVEMQGSAGGTTKDGTVVSAMRTLRSKVTSSSPRVRAWIRPARRSSGCRTTCSG